MTMRVGTPDALGRCMDRRFLALAALGMLCLATQAQAQAGPGSPDLTRYAAGALPPEFLTTWRTGQGAPGNWRVVEDASAPGGKAIEQSSAEKTDYRFPLAVYAPMPAQDVEASVRFKAVSGKGDRAGGLAVCQRRMNSPQMWRTKIPHFVASSVASVSAWRFDVGEFG